MVRFLLPVFIFFSLSAFAQIDTTIGISAPKDASSNYKDLAHYLCDAQSSEQAKANAIYNWITHNIKYDVAAMQSGKLVSDKQAEHALKNHKGVCEGYAMLFTAMCREAGLNAVNVDGYAKDWTFDNGDKMYIPRHMWCAVMINGKWQLADPTWGAGGLVQKQPEIKKIINKILHKHMWSAKNLKFEFKYDPQYFMQDPLVFRLKHIPTDPIWQLTDSLMPLRIFEAGDSAVLTFNKSYYELNQSNPELLRISGLDEKQRVFELADRAYAYNNRFPVILAIKQIYKAGSEVEKAFTDSSIQTGLLLINDAGNLLQRSNDYITDQKKTFPGQYSELKKINKEANQDAKKYIRAIKADDKRGIAQCNKYAKSASAKYSKAKKKSSEANKRKQGISPGKIDNVETAKTQKKRNAPELIVLTDSFNARTARFADLQKTIDSRDQRINDLKSKNGARLDSLGRYIAISDSALVLETVSRLNMHDSYNDEVILWSGIFKNNKYAKADTLQKYYFINYDTIATLTDERMKIQVLQLDIYKKNLRTLEQYRKWNSNDTAFTGQYSSYVNDYLDCINKYNSNWADFSTYIKANKKLFAGLSKINHKEMKIVEYMDMAEDTRKKLEEKTLVKKQAFDNKENEKQALAVKKLQKQLHEISDQNN